MGGACGAYGRGIGACRFLICKPEERNYLEDLGADGKILLKWIFKKWDVKA